MTENPCKRKNEDIEICEELARIFGKEYVYPEWGVCTKAQDHITGDSGEWIRYCPQLDFVIGPLNIRTYTKTTNDEYNELVCKHANLFDTLQRMDEKIESEVMESISESERNYLKMLNREIQSEVMFNRYSNKNPRAFIAIEIENKTKEKHVLGGYMQASAIGKIGIMISPDDDDRYKLLMRIRAYVRFLVAVGKTGDSEHVSLIKNLLLLKRTPFLETLREYNVNV